MFRLRTKTSKPHDCIFLVGQVLDQITYDSKVILKNVLYRVLSLILTSQLLKLIELFKNIYMKNEYLKSGT